MVRRLLLGCTLMGLISAGAASAQSGADAGVPTPRRGTPRLTEEQKKKKLTKEELAGLKELAKEYEPAVPKKYTWDIPMPLERVEVPGIAKGMGVPVKLHAVRSKLGLVDLYQHMRRGFEAAMLYIPPESHITKLTSDPLLTGYDPFRQIGFTVIFQANPDGTTTAILGEAHMSERQAPNANFFAPVYPGAQGTIQSQSEGTQMLAYATGAPEPEIQKFYRDQLTKLGYTEYKPMTFKKGTEQLLIQYNASPQLANGVVVSRLPYSEDTLPKSK